MFGQGSFTIDQNTTPEMLRKKREQLMAMMPQYGKARYVGEGLGQLAYGIGSGIKTRKMDKYEGERSKEATDQYNAALSGYSPSAGPLSVLGMAPGGTWTPDAPPPSPTDVPQASGGLSFGMGQPDMPQEGSGGLAFTPPPMTPQQMIIAGAEARGLDPIDVATAISYETGGTFDPVKGGPTTQWGQHRGLIQFGEPQAQQYGADFSSPDAAMKSQLDPETGAVWGYLDGTGVKPGMGLDNIYSAINAGAPGRFNASDANNGGAPGTVADKVAGMGDHRKKAAEFLGGTWTPAEASAPGMTVSTRGGPQPGGAGPDLQSLIAAASNPWLTPEQRGMINGLIQQQQGRDNAVWQQQLAQSDPMYQAQLAEAQRAAQPQAPKPIEVGGVLLDPTTYQPIFDSRTPDAPEPFTLGEGQVRYGPDGKIIAEGQPKAPASPSAVQEYNFYANQEQQAGRKPLSFNEWDLQGKKAGATSVNVGGAPGDDALRKKLMEGEGTTWSNYLTAGTTSAGMTQDMELLKQVIELAPQGPISGRLAQMFPGVSDAAGVFQSVVKRVAPSLRVEGSGSQSDIEYNGFLQSLPALSNRPEANRAIATFLEAKAKINMERAQAIQAYQDGTADAPATRAKIAEIDRKSILSPELKGLLGGMDGGAAVNDDAEYLKSLGLE